MEGPWWRILLRPTAAVAAPPGRDLRLDFFRGLALWFIFVDHIPTNVVSWLTIRNYGFSDATEIFFFVSGYSAALAYGGVMRRNGFLLGAARILRRCWQLYTAHIVLFVVFVAQIAYVATTFDNPMFSEEMNVIGFLNEPHVTLIQALLLKFKPANMDVLPVYIVLLAFFPPVLWFLLRWPGVTIGYSAALYVAARLFDWNLPAYPEPGAWYFNPFAWQFLFVLGAAFGRLHGKSTAYELNPRLFVPLAVGYLAFAFAIALTWHVPQWGYFVPAWLGRLMYPIDKTDLDLLRLVHFFAIAYLTSLAVRTDARFLRSSLAWPIVLCGQRPLAVFCVGIFLSFLGFFVLVEFFPSIQAQIVISIAGIAIMTGVAFVLNWYHNEEKASAARRGSPAGVHARGEATNDD